MKKNISFFVMLIAILICAFELVSCGKKTPVHQHTEIIVPSVEATCTSSGLTEGKKCADCDEILVAQEIIPSKGHTEVIISKVEASCTESGLTEGKKCSVCNEVLSEQVEVSAKGHIWNNGIVIRESTDSVDGVKEFTCENCNEKRTEIIPKLIDAKIVASGDLAFENNTASITVNNDVTTFDFKNIIEVSYGAKWVLSKDQYGFETIITKIAPLASGNNTFYLIVTSSNELIVEIYTVNIRRKPIYTISFDADGGTSVNSMYIEEGRTIESFPETSKAGYALDGWFNGDTKVEAPYTITSDLNLKAHYSENRFTKYVVNHFKQNLNYTYNTIPDDVDTLYGATNSLTKATLKEYVGYVSPELTQVVISADGSTVINLYYEISFVVNVIIYDDGSSWNSSLKVSSAADLINKLDQVEIPQTYGYSFEGWYMDYERTIPLTSSTNLKFNEENNVYIKYIERTFTVNYVCDTGNSLDTAGTVYMNNYTAEYGDLINVLNPITPALYRGYAEYSFMGWYKDSSRTEAVDSETVRVDKNMIFYAKWEIIEIKTVSDFKSYVNSNQKVNAILTDDIDFEGTELSRSKTNADLAGILKEGTEFNGALRNKFYGNGHSIKNMVVKSDAKGGAIWASLKSGAVIKDISFIRCSLISTYNDKAGFVAASVEGIVEIENVVFDGFTGTMTKLNGILIGQSKNSGLDVSISKVVFNNVELSQSGQANGAIIGYVDSTSLGTINIRDIIVNSYIVDGQKKSDRTGIIIGNIKLGVTKDIEINIDGVVISGEIKDVKGLAAVVVSDGAATISIKNVVIADFKGSNYYDLNANTVVLKYSNALTADITIDNVVYRQSGLILEGNNQSKSEMEFITDGLQGVACTQAEILAKTVSSNITVDILAKAFEMTVNGTKYSVAILEDNL